LPVHMRRFFSGEIEVLIKHARTLNVVPQVLPFVSTSKVDVLDDHVRLKYRYIDLRRERMQSMCCSPTDWIMFNGRRKLAQSCPNCAQHPPLSVRDSALCRSGDADTVSSHARRRR
jgi:hypothetical protein